jgi:hypothetical protein
MDGGILEWCFVLFPFLVSFFELGVWEDEVCTMEGLELAGNHDGTYTILYGFARTARGNDFDE